MTSRYARNSAILSCLTAFLTCCSWIGFGISRGFSSLVAVLSMIAMVIQSSLFVAQARGWLVYKDDTATSTSHPRNHVESSRDAKFRR